MKTYSPDDIKRLREAAVVIVGEVGQSSLERFELIEDFVRKSVRAGKSVTSIEREADHIAIEEGRDLLADISTGDAARWQDPGFLPWIEKRKLTIEGMAV